MMISSAAGIKSRAKELGAELCGITPAERFADAPRGFHPADVVKDCQSVIVVAAPFPLSSLAASSQAAYSFVRNRLADKMDSISFQLAAELEDLGGCAVPIPSTDPYDYWDDARRHGQGIISLKHAAVLAGLGQMGKNTLLVNDKLGNMLWLGAVLSDMRFDPDPVAGYQTCPPECRICLDACPAQALDGTTIVQARCRPVMGKYTEGGGFVYACNMCRRVCPSYRGLR